MHGDPDMARALAKAAAVQAEKSRATAKVVLCPPATLLHEVSASLSNDTVQTSGQDCSPHAEGAYTGDVSATLLKHAGCSYVIVGHSERRTHHRETSDEVQAKATAAMAAGLVAIICIGETDSERVAGKAEMVVGEQVRKSIPKEAGEGNFILAYEPVWAIGTGKTPTGDDIKQMHAYIISQASEATGLAPGQISVLYGGSVKASNAKEILATEGVSGVLVGGASLKADEFNAIIAAAA